MKTWWPTEGMARVIGRSIVATMPPVEGISPALRDDLIAHLLCTSPDLLA